MAKCKKTPPKQQLSEKIYPSKDTNSQAWEEFLRLITADDTLNQTWKDALTPLVSEKIPDDLSPLQNLIDGGPHAETQTTQN
jgi:hypothetical protein